MLTATRCGTCTWCRPVNGDLRGTTVKEIRSILEAAAAAAAATQVAAAGRRFIVNCIVATFALLGLCGAIFGVIWVHDSQEGGPTDPGVLGALCFLGSLCALAGAFAMKDVVKASANKEGIIVNAEDHIRDAEYKIRTTLTKAMRLLRE